MAAGMGVMSPGYGGQFANQMYQSQNPMMQGGQYGGGQGYGPAASGYGQQGYGGNYGQPKSSWYGRQ